MNNASKLWLQKTLNQSAIRRAQDAIAATGSALPCRVVSVSGSIVTVAFEVDSEQYTLPRITIPKVESNWIRNPTQIGDTGITIAADVHIGIISGLGVTLPKISTRPGNLSALMFLPVSNKASPPQDQNAAIVQGPNGFIGQVVGENSSVAANSTEVILTFGTNTVVVNSAGITLTASGQVFELSSSGITLNGINFGTHYHYVPAAPGNSNGPA